MGGRGRQTFNKNMKEQKRREKQQLKAAKRAERKNEPGGHVEEEEPVSHLALLEELASVNPRQE